MFPNISSTRLYAKEKWQDFLKNSLKEEGLNEIRSYLLGIKAVSLVNVLFTFHVLTGIVMIYLQLKTQKIYAYKFEATILLSVIQLRKC